ncbi:MAG: hypothetical protein M3082_07285 [Candidatus Dormibacteraeota bacterium]|nr:hypothetical protein [Candidatus Dormibacteraeota bacterium]
MLRLDPESENCFELLREIVAEEIDVRVALGNSEPTPKNVNLWATLAADAALNAFVYDRDPQTFRVTNSSTIARERWLIISTPPPHVTFLIGWSHPAKTRAELGIA